MSSSSALLLDFRRLRLRLVVLLALFRLIVWLNSRLMASSSTFWIEVFCSGSQLRACIGITPSLSRYGALTSPWFVRA
jgi:hypothetical protein